MYWNNSRYYGLSLYYGIGGHFKHFMWPQLVLLLLQRTFFIFDVFACGHNMKVNDFLIFERELVICELWSCELWVRLQQLTSCKFIRDSCEFSSIYVLANYFPTKMQARLDDNRNMYHLFTNDWGKQCILWTQLTMKVDGQQNTLLSRGLSK
jgi:hypothetical protein